MPEALVLAITGSITAVCQVVLKSMEGQTPDQRKQMWDWFIADVEAWRKFWGIDPK